MAAIDAVRTRHERTALGAAGAVVAAAALAAIAGPAGVPAGVLLLGAWALLSVPAALAVGHLALVAVVPDGLTLPSLALVEAGFLLVVAGPLVRRGADPRVAAAAVLVPIALAGVVAAGLLAFDSIVAAGVALAVAAALLAYGVHRYELYRLGLVEP